MIKAFSRDSRTVFCCFEGKDSGYYGIKIRSQLTPLDVGFFNCNGKATLLLLGKLTRENEALAAAKILFFVDRDYEVGVEGLGQNFFVTDGYSVENYYTSDGTVERIVRSAIFSDEIYREDDNACVEAVLCNYRRLRVLFHDIIKLFNFWAWVHRHERREFDGEINLNVFDRPSLFTMTMENVGATYTLEQLNARCPARNPITVEEIEMAGNWFQGRNASWVFRGKQELQFLVSFLRTLVERAALGEAPFGRRIRCGIRLSEKRAIEDLSIYADTPGSLRDFLGSARTTWINSSSGDCSQADCQP